MRYEGTSLHFLKTARKMSFSLNDSFHLAIAAPKALCINVNNNNKKKNFFIFSFSLYIEIEYSEYNIVLWMEIVK